jgi:hypothetical protein
MYKDSEVLETNCKQKLREVVKEQKHFSVSVERKGVRQLGVDLSKSDCYEDVCITLYGNTSITVGEGNAFSAINPGIICRYSNIPDGSFVIANVYGRLYHLTNPLDKDFSI